MQTIKIEIEDSKVDIFLTILQNLKENVVARYELISDAKENKDFIAASQKSLEQAWDNPEDAVYDKFL